jgi:hypothetical protein
VVSADPFSRSSDYDRSIALQIRHFLFKNELLNVAYLVTFLIAFATHSIWLAHCAICPNVPLWYGFVNWFPKVAVVIDPSIIIPVLGALLVGIFFFVAESLRDTNISIRSRVILQQSEIVPLTGCFVLLMLLINAETRITFLLPAFVLTAHTLYSLGTILRLLADSQRMYDESIAVFKEEACTELLTIQKSQYDQNQSAVLREFQQIASTALNSGDVSQYVYAQGYFEAYLDVVLVENSNDGLKNLIVAYKDLIITTQIVDRNAIYQKVITKVFKMYISTLRLQKYEQAKDILQLLVLLQWPQDEISQQKTNQICSIINTQFDSYFRGCLPATTSAEGQKEYQMWLQTTLDVVYYLTLTGIERNMPAIVGDYLTSMYNLVEATCHEINNSVSNPNGEFHYQVARQVDAFVLRVAACSLKHDVDNKQVNHGLFNHEMFNTLIDTVKKSSPTFYYLIHAIATWSCQKNKQILMCNASDGLIDKSIYTLTTVMILHQLRKTHNVYAPGFCDESLCTKANIQEFIQALHDDAQWIRDQQAMLMTYIEDIDGEINSWLLRDIDTLIASYQAQEQRDTSIPQRQ